MTEFIKKEDFDKLKQELDSLKNYVNELHQEIESCKSKCILRDDLIALDQVYRQSDGKRVVHTNQEFLNKHYRNKNGYIEAMRLGYVIKAQTIDGDNKNA